MSRIHDALKQAEQERATTFPPESTPLAPAPRPVPSPEEAPPNGLEGLAPAPTSSVSRLGAPALPAVGGVLPGLPSTRWQPDAQMLLFSNSKTNPLGSEEFRTLRTRLLQMREKLPLQTLLVTSALPGEGKSFVAANLALSFAQQVGRRVLLLDCDLRLSRLHVLFGCAATPGLAEFLRGEAEASSILQRGPDENFCFIPGGKPPSDPIELLGNGRLKGLLQRLAPLFDWIVVDSPPCVPLSDASMLSDLCDGVLMVVKAGKTPYDVAQKGSALFRDRHLLGVVVNHVAPQTAYSAYYYRASEPQKEGKPA
jgi:protein-tyrosine kinase